MKILILNSKDNVAVALTPLKKGTKLKVDAKEIEILTSIPQGHKFAIKEIKKGEKVLKDGEVIGVASRKISRGEHVHIQNLKSRYKR